MSSSSNTTSILGSEIEMSKKQTFQKIKLFFQKNRIKCLEKKSQQIWSNSWELESDKKVMSILGGAPPPRKKNTKITREFSTSNGSCGSDGWNKVDSDRIFLF